MHFERILASSLCFVAGLGLVTGAFAQAQPVAGQELRSTINADVIDTNNELFRNRIRTEMVQKPAPQVGQTRAAIEAIYGPAWEALAPGKNYEIYTNEYDLTDGRMFRRQITDADLRIYEVSYSTGAMKTANDKAVDVKLRVIPRIGDHKNLVSKMLGEPYSRYGLQDGQHVVFGVPKHRYVFYNEIIDDPFTAINMYFNTQDFLVGQEFMPSRKQGEYVLTSAGRYVEFQTRSQPDRNIGK